MNEVSVRFNPSDRLIDQRHAFVELSGRHEALDESELEARVEHLIAHRLELLQAAPQSLDSGSCVTSADRYLGFVAAGDGEVGCEGMGFGV